MLANLCGSLKYFFFFSIPSLAPFYATNLICKKPPHPKKNKQSQRGDFKF